MDARLPFAAGEDRLRLLYQLSSTGAVKRVLVIGSRAQAQTAFSLPMPGMCNGPAWELEWRAPGAVAPAPAAEAFDVVALPGTLTAALDDPRAPVGGPSPDSLLSSARALLRPGGTVVGHLRQALSLRELPRLCRSRALWQRWRTVAPIANARRCRDSLERLGFDAPECYFVEPRITDPMALVSADPFAARGHFIRTVQRNRPLYSAAGFAVRMALAQTGLGGTLQPDIFFWARRPC